MLRTVVAVFICISYFVVNAKWDWKHSRHPVTANSPRRSSDPFVTTVERLIAKTKGENVCVSREKSEIKVHCRKYLKRRYSRCRRFREYFTKFKCCDGYEAVKGQRGCPKDKFSSNLKALQIAKRLGLTFFARIVKKTFLHHILRLSRQLTIFIPTNEALKTFFASKIGSKVYKNNYYLRIFVLSHLVGGKWPRLRLLDKKRVESILPGRYRAMNIKFYKKVLTIENALVIVPDQASSNAVIHVVDRVLRRPQGTVMSVLKRHPQLTIFNRGLQHIGHVFLGRNTLFVPNDETFAREGIRTTKQLLDKIQCVKKFLFAHIVPGLWYLSILRNSRTLFTSDTLGKRVFVKLINRHIFINEFLTKVEYIGATDGAIFIINRFLSFTDALSVQQLLQRLPALSTMEKLLDKTKIGQSLRSENSSRVTIFAPVNSVFRRLNNTEKAKLENLTNVMNFVNFHIVPGEYQAANFYDDMMLESKYNGENIRINTRRNNWLICAQGSRVSSRYRNLKACNATIHVLISNTLKPSTISILDIVKSDQRLTVLYTAIQFVGLAETLDSPSSLTLFAPTNDAWIKLSNQTLTRMFNDLNQLRDVVQYHVLVGTFYRCIIYQKLLPLSLAGRRVHLTTDGRRGTNIKFNYAQTVQTDIRAKNGVVHLLDDVVTQLYERRGSKSWKN